jgi:3-hydroxyacyl-[acyl-carrier-protein] dehydratase
LSEPPVTEADIDLIQRILPHRFPFLMIDRVRDIEAGRSATGVKLVTINEPHFQGHFPGSPIMPGVLFVEAMGQTAGVLTGVSEGLVDTGFLIYLMSVEKAKFRRMVRPGDVVELPVEVTRRGSRVLRFAGRALVDGAVVAEAEFTAMIDRSTGEGAAPA